MNRTLKFTIWHGIAVSLLLHSAFSVPFVVHDLMPEPDDAPLLVIDLEGVVSDSQTEQKVMQQVKGAAKQQNAQMAKPAQAATPPSPPPEDAQKDVEENGDMPPSPPPTPQQAQPVAPTPAALPQSGSAGAQKVKGEEEKQVAHTIKDRETEKDRINAYVKALGAKVRANLVYPDDGRRSAAMVSFTILSSGQIRPGSLKIAESSGQPALDNSALKTIRDSVPFDPPPHEMTIAITVDFDRRR